MSDTFPRGEAKWLVAEGVPLVRITPDSQVAVCTGTPVISYYMHWNERIRRTQPCFLYECDGCKANDPRRPLSYVRAMVWTYWHEKYIWRASIVEIPWTTGVTISQMPGKVLALRREHRFGPVDVGTFLFDSEPPIVPVFDIVPLLQKLWRVDPKKQLSLVGNRGPDVD